MPQAMPQFQLELERLALAIANFQDQTDKTLNLSIHEDMGGDYRYRITQARPGHSKGSLFGWGPTPMEAWQDIERQHSIAANQDNITVKVEAYRKQLEQEAGL